MARTNLQTNPSFETNVTGWTVSGAGANGVTTPSRNATAGNGAVQGAAYAFLTAGAAGAVNLQSALMPVTVGLPYALSMLATRSTTGTSVRVDLDWYNGSTFLSTSSATFTVAAANQWGTRRAVVGTAPANATGARCYLAYAGMASGETAYLDAVLFEQASAAGTYFDGDSGNGAAWTGTPHASTSTAPDPAQTLAPSGIASTAALGSPSVSGTVGPTDGFDTDLSLWPVSYGGSAVVSGRGRVPSRVAPPDYSAIDTGMGALPLAGRRFHVEVPRVAPVGDSTGAVWTSAYLWSQGNGSGARIGFEYNAASGMLACVSQTDYSDPGQVQLAYSPTAHRWWRVRHTGSTVAWETSPDGVDWTTRRVLATPPAWTTNTDTRISLESYRANGTPDYAEFDNVNQQTPPPSTLTLTVPGIAPSSATGTPGYVGAPVMPVGIASTAAAGAPTLQLGPTTVAPAGRASSAALGTPNVPQPAPLPGIASTAALGTQTMRPQPVTVAAAGIASTAALGVPTVQRGPVTAVPTGIPSGARFGTATLTTGPVTVNVGGLGPVAQLGGALRVQRVLSPRGVPPREVRPTRPATWNVGRPTLTVGARSSALQGIAPTSAVGAPGVAPAARTVRLQGIAGARLGTPTAAPSSPVTVTPTGIASTSSCGTPTVTRPGAVRLAPTGIPGGARLGTPTVRPGARTATPSGVSAGSRVGSPTVRPRPVTLAPPGATRTTALGTPSVARGAVASRPAGIASGSRVGAVSVRRSPRTVASAGIAPSSGVGAPTVTRSARTVALVGIPRSSRVGAPRVELVPRPLAPVGIGPGARTGTPELEVAPVRVAPSGIPGARVGAPALVVGGLTLTPAGIPSGVRLGTPIARAGPGPSLPRPGRLTASERPTVLRAS